MDVTVTQDIRNFVINTFLLGDSTRLTDATSFIDEGLIDSTGILELVGFIEEHYGVVVADHELIPDNLDSVTKVASYLQAKLAEQQIPTVA